MAFPSLEEVKELLDRPEHADKNLVPVYLDYTGDLETPVSAFLKIRNGSHSFLLESVEKGERMGRYSFIGTDPLEVITVGGTSSLSGDPLAHLQRVMHKYRVLPLPSSSVQPLSPFMGGAVGFLTYDAVRFFEPRVSPFIEKQQDTMELPDGQYMICDTVLVFDHVKHIIKIVSHVHLQGAEDARDLAERYSAAVAKINEVLHKLSQPLMQENVVKIPCTVAVGKNQFKKQGQPQRVSAVANPDAADDDLAPPESKKRNIGASAVEWDSASNVGKHGYQQFVKTLKHHIKEGDIIQAVPSQRIAVKMPEKLKSFELYRQLRIVNPSPYMFYVEMGEDLQIVGTSPEMLVKVDADGIIETHPIAGTRRRGRTTAEDVALEQEMLGDEKERAEHIMLVDLARNDVGRVSAPGTVKVDSFMKVERYSHVMHLVSVVTGQLSSALAPLDVFRSVFPAGTLSGAPKVKAMELVASMEPERRGIYGGSVGYFGFSGVLDTAIAIRTLVIRNGIIYCQAGGGIVHDSNPADEYLETMNKLAVALTSIQAMAQANDLPITLIEKRRGEEREGDMCT